MNSFALTLSLICNNYFSFIPVRPDTKLLEILVKDILSRLNHASDDVQKIGIWDGIGKTILHFLLLWYKRVFGASYGGFNINNKSKYRIWNSSVEASTTGRSSSRMSESESSIPRSSRNESISESAINRRSRSKSRSATGRSSSRMSESKS
ncbi:hypothetical protein TIFTF001_002095, partial [Ficus carica]